MFKKVLKTLMKFLTKNVFSFLLFSNHTVCYYILHQFNKFVKKLNFRKIGKGQGVSPLHAKTKTSYC